MNNKIVLDRKKITISLTGTICLFLALAPVLDPYILVEIGAGITIRVNDIFAIALAAFAVSYNYKFDRRYGFTVYWCFVMAVLSIFGLLGSNGTSLSIAYKNIFVWFVYSILVMYLWKHANREYFFTWVERIAFICVIVVILQFILGNIGISVWDGKISFLRLSKYDNWSGFVDPNTGDIRPCGIFQEASYVGIFLLVAYSNALKNNKIKIALVYAITMMLTSSMVAILGCVIVTIYLLFLSGNKVVDKRIKIKIILAIICGVLLSVLAGGWSLQLQSLWAYVSRRLLSISSDLQGTRVGSTKWRILGHIDLFGKYNFWQKSFGFGAQQYANYFGVVNYSNNMVNIVLNYGIVGVACFLYLFYKLFRMINKENIVFFVVTMIVFFIDQQWFNWFFFYLLTACILNDNIDRTKNQQ